MVIFGMVKNNVMTLTPMEETLAIANANGRPVAMVISLKEMKLTRKKNVTMGTEMTTITALMTVRRPTVAMDQSGMTLKQGAKSSVMMEIHKTRTRVWAVKMPSVEMELSGTLGAQNNVMTRMPTPMITALDARTPSAGTAIFSTLGLEPKNATTKTETTTTTAPMSAQWLGVAMGQSGMILQLGEQNNVTTKTPSAQMIA